MVGLYLDILMPIHRTFLLLLFLILPAFAQLSPGELHQAHASLEGIRNCTQCHSRGRKVSPGKCLNCHALLKARIQEGKGLHSRSEFQNCVLCHVEHQGRNFDLVYWKEGEKNFDHRLSGFLLEGAHRSLPCRECHTAKNIRDPGPLIEQEKDLNRTYLGLSRKCLSCHWDEHRGQVSEDCLSCHTMRGWKPASKFDHRNTRFRLTGRHERLTCTKCHLTLRDAKNPQYPTYTKFVDIPFSGCGDCHKDVHRGKFGADCSSCHQTRGWRQIYSRNFDHNKTDYPLEGKHTRVSCAACHGSTPLAKLKHEQCRDCHADYHQGQFRKRKSRGECAECHTVQGFAPARFSIENHQKTRFPLRDGHLAVPCNQCHISRRRSGASPSPIFRFPSLDCQACHRHPHPEFQQVASLGTGCTPCHNESSWKKIQFDHSITSFSLEGKHADLACVRCHIPLQLSGETRHVVFQGLKKDCQNCHEDKHGGQFANGRQGMVRTDCSRCHSASSWKAEKFDHNRDARFKLEGGHAAVGCDKCHRRVLKGGTVLVIYKPVETACQSCHALEK